MSNSDKHIKKVIKDSFDKEQRKAPEGLWTNISQASNLTDDEYKIRESFNNNEKSAPSKTWSNVKRQLIIDEVWDNIVIYQDRRKRRFIWWFVGSASIMILILSLSVINLENNNKGSKIAEIKKDTITQENSTLSNNIDTKNSETTVSNEAKSKTNQSEITSNSSKIGTDNISSFPKSIEGKKTNSNHNNLLDTKEPPLNVVDKSTANEPINLIMNFDSSSATRIFLDRVPSKGIQSIEVSFLQPKLIANFDTVQKETFNRFEVGLIASLGNSWIFNNDVKNGMNRNSLINNNLSSGYSVGALLEYHINKRSGIELEYDFYSVYNQGYDFYNEGRLIHKDIRLKQQKVSLDYKFRFLNNPYNKRTLLIKSGIFFSHSIKEQTSINWVENAANSSFATFDYGLNLGVGFEQSISKFKVEYGIKTDVGLHNITANSINFPKKFNYTNTCILSGYMSFKYSF